MKTLFICLSAARQIYGGALEKVETERKRNSKEAQWGQGEEEFEIRNRETAMKKIETKKHKQPTKGRQVGGEKFFCQDTKKYF